MEKIKSILLAASVLLAALLIFSCSDNSNDSCCEDLIDLRDGAEYKTVKIDNKIWMAKNLNYDISGSSCYGGALENCEKYGRLYSWELAKTACPSNWRLPSKEEWEALVRTTGYFASKLKAAEWNGTDNYGFSALPGGNYFVNGIGSCDEPFNSFCNLNEKGFWWGTAKLAPYILEIGNVGNGFIYHSDLLPEYESNSFSIRCVSP